MLFRSLDPLDRLARFSVISRQQRSLAEQTPELLSLRHHAWTVVDAASIWIRGVCGMRLSAARNRTLGKDFVATSHPRVLS